MRYLFLLYYPLPQSTAAAKTLADGVVMDNLKYSPIPDTGYYDSGSSWQNKWIISVTIAISPYKVATHNVQMAARQR